MSAIVPPISSLFPNYAKATVKTSSLVIPATLTAFAKGIGNSLNQFVKSTSTGAKIAKVGLGLGVAGGAISVGTSVASQGVVESGQTLSKGFGIPTELIFIIGAILLVLVLTGGKRR